MPLNIDTSRALRTPDQLVALVRSVLDARPEDESRAVEWKSHFDDVTSPEASFVIARAILGLANRPVNVARSAFDGVGYVLVGVEPGSLHGQGVPDSAELHNAIRRYAGNSTALWDPRSIEVDGQQVLVVTVEAPRSGDRIALLNKSYQPSGRKPLVEEGTIFVRQPGATNRATRLDVEMLQDRLLEGTEVQAEAARRAERDHRLRELVGEVVGAATRWANAAEVLIMATSSDKWTQKDWIEWVNTDSGKAMAIDAQNMEDRTRSIRLLTDDPVLLAPLAQAKEVMKDGAVFEGLHASGSDSGESRALAYGRLKALRALFSQLEEAAAASLSH
ncbi:helix-turn-helix domain-containing protein [Curtobacterium sp. UNCCL20]|uniref:AlbA family DNA-binding domain-containing protein n=1 Tax=Curtobacterium sp. UNCCL20 TaxID=1502773 RepID=UPI001113543A|nr:hypothetical protein [Curtobacterium sp. UNCCL20]